MSAAVITCPQCQQLFSAAAPPEGEAIGCPACGQSVVLPALPGTAEKHAAAASALALQKTADTLRAWAPLLMLIGVVAGLCQAVMGMVGGRGILPGIAAAGAGLGLGLALMLFARLATLQAELCLIRAAMLESRPREL